MNINDPKQAFEAETDEHGQEQARAMSMLNAQPADGLAEEDPLLGMESGSTEGRNLLGQTTLLIVLVAVIAAVSLFAMRVSHGEVENDSGSDVLAAQVENWITKLSSPDYVDLNDPLHPNNLSALFADTDDVLRVLNTDSREHQVPVQYVKKDPFTFTLVESNRVDYTASASDYEHQRQQRRAQLQRQLENYSVSSIMVGRRNVAMINGEMYQLGDHLGEFVIEQIDPMKVTLRNGQEMFTLGMGEREQKPGR